MLGLQQSVLCGEKRLANLGDNTEGDRSFALGFTDFPHAFTLEALIAAFAVIEKDGDMAVMHFDGGVPWQEALDGLPYPQPFLDSINFKAAAIPSDHFTYLAVTPVAFSRDKLADNRGTTENEPLTPPWDTRTFDHPEVIEAFTNHCENMIEIYSPQFFAYAIEANMLINLAPSEWDAFVILAQSVYSSLKLNHPTLPVFLTLQAEWFYKDTDNQKAGISRILPFTDYIAVSSYAYSDQADPDLLEVDYFTELSNLAPAKPFAIAETTWPAEDVTDPFPVLIPATEATQQAYVKRLLSDCDKLSAAFVCWFISRDFDDFWESDLQFEPSAPIIRFWKDSGLYDGEGNSRPSLTIWRQYLAMQHINTTPVPTSTPTPTFTPELTPTPTATPDIGGKAFTFRCNKKLQSGSVSFERLVLKLGENEQCTLKLTNLEPGVAVEISSQLRKGVMSAIKIEPSRSFTDANGELEVTITSLHKGVDWVAWAVKNDKGKFEFSKSSYNEGYAWGMFVEIQK